MTSTSNEPSSGRVVAILKACLGVGAVILGLIGSVFLGIVTFRNPASPAKQVAPPPPPLSWYEKADFAAAGEDLMNQCILPHRKHVEGKNPLAIADSEKSIAAVLEKAKGKKVRWHANVTSITTDFINAAPNSYFRSGGMFRGDFVSCRLSASNNKSESYDLSFAIGKDVSREEAVKYRLGDSFWIQGEVADAIFSEHLTGYLINIYLINVKH